MKLSHVGLVIASKVKEQKVSAGRGLRLVLMTDAEVFELKQVVENF